jgi:hypothetical protein
MHMIVIRSRNSSLGAYLWSVHDFMARGIFSGWSVHGKLTCPICGKETDCFQLKFGGKICYFDCHRCFLPRNHAFRLQKNAFRRRLQTSSMVWY